MGNTASTSTSTGNRTQKVFAKELKSLSDTINSIISSDGTSFKDNSYNFLNEKSCRDFTIVLSHKLKKHLKVDLQGTHDSIYLLPKQDEIYEDKRAYKKDNLCMMISSYYVRVLRILSLIRSVYDMEHSGDMSLAGITWRNIRRTPSVLQVFYCETSQTDANGNGRTVDFAQLPGLKLFVENFLTKPKERGVFLAHFQSMLDMVPVEKIAKYATCGNDLLSTKDYNNIFGSEKCSTKISNEFQSFVERQNYARNPVNLKFTVHSGNLVFASQFCDKHQQYILIDTSKKTESVKNVLRLYDVMYTNYTKNLANITGCVKEIVDVQTFKLRNMDNHTLDGLERRVIKYISIFYLQTLADYQRLLEMAKKIPNAIVAHAEIPIVRST